MNILHAICNMPICGIVTVLVCTCVCVCVCACVCVWWDGCVGVRGLVYMYICVCVLFHLLHSLQSERKRDRKRQKTSGEVQFLYIQVCSVPNCSTCTLIHKLNANEGDR